VDHSKNGMMAPTQPDNTPIVVYDQHLDQHHDQDHDSIRIRIQQQQRRHNPIHDDNIMIKQAELQSSSLSSSSSAFSGVKTGNTTFDASTTVSSNQPSDYSLPAYAIFLIVGGVVVLLLVLAYAMTSRCTVLRTWFGIYCCCKPQPIISKVDPTEITYVDMQPMRTNIEPPGPNNNNNSSSTTPPSPQQPYTVSWIPPSSEPFLISTINPSISTPPTTTTIPTIPTPTPEPTLPTQSSLPRRERPISTQSSYSTTNTIQRTLNQTPTTTTALSLPRSTISQTSSSTTTNQIKTNLTNLKTKSISSLKRIFIMPESMQMQIPIHQQEQQRDSNGDVIPEWIRIASSQSSVGGIENSRLARELFANGDVERRMMYRVSAPPIGGGISGVGVGRVDVDRRRRSAGPVLSPGSGGSSSASFDGVGSPGSDRTMGYDSDDESYGGDDEFDNDGDRGSFDDEDYEGGGNVDVNGVVVESTDEATNKDIAGSSSNLQTSQDANNVEIVVTDEVVPIPTREEPTTISSATTKLSTFKKLQKKISGTSWSEVFQQQQQHDNDDAVTITTKSSPGSPAVNQHSFSSVAILRVDKPPGFDEL
ncbi:hypothetical protein HDU76_008102, partial [Blyttiomyces sp. JEL0837]